MIQDQVKDTYNQIAEHFSKTRRFVWPETLKELEKLKSGDQLLDLGCGNGRLLTGIKNNVEYIGIDFSKTLLKNARHIHPERKFIYGDITKSKVWKGLPKFDAIFCIAVLHHISERKKQLYVLNKSRSILKNGGVLNISVWNFLNFRHLDTHFSKESLKLKRKNWRYLYEPYQNKWNRFYVAFDKAYLRKLLNEAGFKNTDIFYVDRKGNKSNMLRGCNLCATAAKGD